jgi:hypothetical protein
MSVSGLPASLPAAGGRFGFAVTTPSGCSWTARDDVPWADVAPGSGQGSATPALTVDENSSRDSRTVTVTVNGQSTRIMQHGIGCSYQLGQTTVDVSGDGGSASIGLTATEGCAWTATVNETWVTVLTPSGTGSDSIKLDITPNYGGLRRAFLTVAGLRLEITQQPR